MMQQEHERQPLKKNNKNAIRKSESRTGLSLLTRATSFMTWDTYDTSSRAKQQSNYYNDDEEAQLSPRLLKRVSLQSLSGFMVLPTIYGSANEPCDDENMSECSYVTG